MEENKGDDQENVADQPDIQIKEGPTKDAPMTNTEGENSNQNGNTSTPEKVNPGEESSEQDKEQLKVSSSDTSETNRSATDDEFMGAGDSSIDVLSAGQLAPKEKAIRQALVDELGNSRIAKSIDNIYKAQSVVPDGLHVIVASHPFGMAWSLGQSQDSESRLLIRGNATRLTKIVDLKSVAPRYASDGVLTILISDESANNDPFWNLNKNFTALDNIARNTGLRLFLLFSPALMDALSSNLKLQDELLKYHHELSPEPGNAFIKLVQESDAPENIITIAGGAGLQDGILLTEALSHLQEKRWPALLQTLQTTSYSTLHDNLRETFERAVIDEYNREPAATAALFVGAHFPGLPTELFREMCEIAFICAENHWPTPPQPSGDNPPRNPHRQWRNGFHDDAMNEAGLIMRLGPDGARRSVFASRAAAQYYENAFAERASEIRQALFNGLLRIGQPLDRPAELMVPFTRFFARQLRDSYGNHAQPMIVAKKIFGIIRWHRLDVEIAYEKFEEEHRKLSEQQGNFVKTILSAVDAQKREASVRHLDAVAPDFIRRTIVALYRNDANERAVETVEALWAIARETYPHSDKDEREQRFWRQTVSGAMFATDSPQSIQRLEQLFGGTPQSLATLANGAWGGLRDDDGLVSPAILIETLCYSVTSIDQAKNNRFRAWRIGALLGLLTIWMHNNTVYEHTESVYETELLENVVFKLFQKPVVKTIRKLPQVCRDLDQAASNTASTKDPWVSGMLSRQLVIARLRMLYGLRGKEFDVLATTIDEAQTRADFRDPDRWSVDASDAGYEAFDAWRREVTGAIGTSILAKIAMVNGIETTTPFLDRLISEIPNSAKQFMQGAKIGRQDIRLIDRSIDLDPERIDELRTLDNTLKEISTYATNNS